jgi:hypothetical protein
MYTKLLARYPYSDYIKILSANRRRAKNAQKNKDFSAGLK